MGGGITQCTRGHNEDRPSVVLTAGGLQSHIRIRQTDHRRSKAGRTGPTRLWRDDFLHVALKLDTAGRRSRARESANASLHQLRDSEVEEVRAGPCHTRGGTTQRDVCRAEKGRRTERETRASRRRGAEERAAKKREKQAPGRAPVVGAATTCPRAQPAWVLRGATCLPFRGRRLPGGCARGATRTYELRRRGICGSHSGLTGRSSCYQLY